MKILNKLVLISAAFVLAACDSDDPVAQVFNNETPTASFQVLHASPDAPPVNVLVNGAVALSDVDFRDGSGRSVVDTGTYTVQVDAILPSGSATVIGPVDLTFDADTTYTIVAVNDTANIEPVVLTQNRSGVSAGSARLYVLHAAAAAPEVDVYVTDPAVDDLAGVAPNDSFEFKETIGPLVVPAGDYRIRVTLGGTKTVVYDSGSVALADGADLFAAAVPNTGLGGAAVQLVALDGSGSATLFDTGTQAAAIAVHLSPDAPAVDVIADVDSTPNDEALKLATGLTFPNFCVINDIPAPADFTLSIAATADNMIVPLQFPLSSTVDGSATAIVSGFLAGGTPAITAVPLASGTRSIVTEAQIRLTHGAPGTGNVDIYLLVDGTDLDDASVTPNFSAVPFGANTGVLSIAPGVYDVYITPAGDKSVRAIEVADLDFAGGEVWDVIARDPAFDGSEGQLPLPLVIDYNNVADCPTP